MKFFIAFILTALLSFLLGLYLPWWSIAIAAFISGVLVSQKSVLSFLAGFAGIFFMWGILAYFINNANQGILAAKMAKILPLGGSVFLLIFFTAFVGALVGGSAALTGNYLRKAI